MTPFQTKVARLGPTLTRNHFWFTFGFGQALAFKRPERRSCSPDREGRIRDAEVQVRNRNGKFRADLQAPSEPGAEQRRGHKALKRFLRLLVPMLSTRSNAFGDRTLRPRRGLVMFVCFIMPFVAWGTCSFVRSKV